MKTLFYGFRGGCWFDLASFCRSAGRYYFEPGFRYRDLGFRVARCDAGTHPRDGLYAWDKLPVILDTTDQAFEMNVGKVWRGDNGQNREPRVDHRSHYSAVWTDVTRLVDLSESTALCNCHFRMRWRLISDNL